MSRPVSDRWGTGAVVALIGLGAVERLIVLCVFGLDHIGIDDALMQGIAVDLGHGVFHEPFMYGQNYNPALEALLAAPFVRLGAAPWAVLPIVTSLLALLPFWSFAAWCLRRGATAAALLFAGMPLLLPPEWGLITTMPRGFVHGIALLALVPWMQAIRAPALAAGLTTLVLFFALVCNPNALPIVAGIGVWMVLRHGREPAFWAGGLSGILPAIGFLWWAGRFYEARPGHVVHPLMGSDLAFDPVLLAKGLGQLNPHFLHMTPLPAEAAFLVLPFMLAVAVLLAWRGWRNEAVAMGVALLAVVASLGIVKVHEGCHSVFFPVSRMHLALPLLTAGAAGLLAGRWRPQRSTIGLFLFAVSVSGAVQLAQTGTVLAREMGHRQECAYVREERLEDVRSLCGRVGDAAREHGADLIVPIRWPGIGEDHRAHFQAHFICYACPQLAPSFPPVLGAGYDRRSWVRDRFANDPPGRVLFVGGDAGAWSRAIAERGGIVRVDAPGTALHVLHSDTATVERVILALGVDDDLGR